MNRVREWHKSLEAEWNDVQSLLQQWASSPVGPAAPLVFRAAVRILEASILSKMTGCGSSGSWLTLSRASDEACWATGCLDFKTSKTDMDGLS